MKYIFLIEHYYDASSGWTLFGRNVFKVVQQKGEHFVHISSPVIIGDSWLKLGDIPTTSYFEVSSKEEIALAEMLYAGECLPTEVDFK